MVSESSLRQGNIPAPQMFSISGIVNYKVQNWDELIPSVLGRDMKDKGLIRKRSDEIFFSLPPPCPYHLNLLTDPKKLE